MNDRFGFLDFVAAMTVAVIIIFIFLGSPKNSTPVSKLTGIDTAYNIYINSKLLEYRLNKDVTKCLLVYRTKNGREIDRTEYLQDVEIYFRKEVRIPTISILHHVRELRTGSRDTTEGGLPTTSISPDTIRVFLPMNYSPKIY